MHTPASVLRLLGLSCAVLASGCLNLRAQANTSAAEPTLPAAQQPAATVQRTDLPPSSIYEQVLAPFDQVRADMANWSDAEMAAYQATTVAAKQECVRIEQTPHEGDEELALARLCTLGHDWDGAFSAARWYTRRNAPNDQHSPDPETQPPPPQSPHAFRPDSENRPTSQACMYPYYT